MEEESQGGREGGRESRGVVSRPHVREGRGETGCNNPPPPSSSWFSGSPHDTRVTPIPRKEMDARMLTLPYIACGAGCHISSCDPLESYGTPEQHASDTSLHLDFVELYVHATLSRFTAC